LLSIIGKKLKKLFFSACIIVSCCQVQAQINHQDSLTTKEKKKELKAPWFVDKFKVSAGAFVPISSTDITVSATGQNGTIGTEINFEDDLGFNNSSWTFLGDIQYRLTRRSRFDLSFIRVNRNSTKTLQKDLIFDEDTFHVNNKTSAFFNSGIYRFSYGYSILTNTKFEVGLLIGFHILNSNAGLSSIGTSTNIAVSKDFGFTAPLPDFGVWGGYAFSDRWSAHGEFNYFSITVGDIGGRIIGGQLNVTYRAYKKLDISAGYNGLNFNVDITKTHAYGNLKWGYNGPSLVVSYSFGEKSWTSD
jgi:hypothetical protein